MTRRPVCSRQVRDGFTLVEVIVATLLLSLAALGVASASTAAAHLASTSRALERASRATARVVDSLRSVSCSVLASGSRTTAEGTVHWTVGRQPGVVSLAAWLLPSSTRVRVPIVEEALLPCE